MSGKNGVAHHEATLKKMKLEKKKIIAGNGAASAQSSRISNYFLSQSKMYGANIKSLKKELDGCQAILKMYEAQVTQLKTLEKLKAAEMKNGDDQKKLAKLEKSIAATDKACAATLNQVESVFEKSRQTNLNIARAADRIL